MALDGFSVLGGVVFSIVIILVLHPIAVPLPYSLSRKLLQACVKCRLIRSETKSKRLRLHLNLTSAPLLGVLILLATTAIDGTVLHEGVLGAEGVEPYNVLILFISLAYISTSLDATGGLRAMAFLVAQKGGKSGSRLFFYLYAFFFLASIVIGNDPVILSGTPFLAYLTKVSGITPPTAWVFSEFVAANVASAVLVSSNPTNVLLSGAFDLNFLSGFTKYTILPTVVAAIAVYPAMFLTFRLASSKDKSYIPHSIVTPEVNPKSALVDPAGMIFHSVTMLVTLAVLVASSWINGGHVQVYWIVLPGATISLVRDVIHDLRRGPHPPATANMELQPSDAEIPTSETAAAKQVSLPHLYNKFCVRFPTTSTTLSRLPWSLLPFAIGMFILVRSLSRLGYIAIFARWTASVATTPATAAFYVGCITSFVLCPLCGTNIGGTILMVEILADPAFRNSVSVQANPNVLKSAIYATAMASNVGALSFTFPSSLAGLLWRTILRQKGIIVTHREFLKWSIIPAIVMTFTSLAMVILVVEKL